MSQDIRTCGRLGAYEEFDMRPDTLHLANLAESHQQNPYCMH